MGYAFISYSSKNQASAEAMRELFKKYHIDTWMAPNDIPVGSKYAQVIGKAVKNCTCLLLLLTDDSQNSPWVAKEVERAINYRKTIVPVQLEDIQLNDEFEMYISTDQIIAVRKIDESSEEIQKVLSSVIALTGNASVDSFSDDKYKNTDDTSSSTLKTIELTVWSPVNTNVYLHDKNHLVMRIDHNAGFDYKRNTINVSDEFNLLFVSKGFEKTISFDASSIGDRLEYHLDAILSKKEIVASYDRDEALEQIAEEATAYAYEQLSMVGIGEDIPLLLAEIEKLCSSNPETQQTDDLFACCFFALRELAVRNGVLEDIRFAPAVHEIITKKLGTAATENLQKSPIETENEKRTDVEAGTHEKTEEDCKFQEISVQLLRLRKDKCEETSTEIQQNIEEYYNQLVSLHTVVSWVSLHAAISILGPERFNLADEEQYERLDSMYDTMFENLAERGDPMDQRNYAEYVHQKYEINKYLYWLAKSADQGEIYSIKDLVEYYYTRSMYEEAYDWIIKLSKCDDVHYAYDACCKLSWMYRTGSGVQQDEAMENKWLTRAQIKHYEMQRN